MYSRQYNSRVKGFTLIELVIVIVIIGILGVGTARFITQATQGFVDTAERQQLATVAWIISEKFSREIRHGLPNSFRTNDAADGTSDGQGSCVEFIPTLAGSDYLSVPVLSAANTFESVPFSNYTTPGSGDRVAVYPSSITGLYSLSNPGMISSTLSSISSGTTANALLLTLSSAHQFTTDSPEKRFYIVNQPIMYCISGSRIYRYIEYGFQASMPTEAFATATGSRIVIGTDLESGSFSYEPGDLSRSGIVTLSFVVQGSDRDGSAARQAISQEVQVSNVP